MYFYTRDVMLVWVFATATCLSVCHAPVLCMIFSPSGSPMILAFWCQISFWHSKGFPQAGPQTRVGWENSAIF